jgi:hypothetical protein
MRIWLALIVAPLVALACQGWMYALVTPSCGWQTAAPLHAIAASSLVLAAGFTLLARREWRGLAGPARLLDDDAGDPRSARHFLAIAATAVGALSALAIAAMWIAVWVLSPCWQ